MGVKSTVTTPEAPDQASCAAGGSSRSAARRWQVRIAAALVCVTAPLGLTGCWQGQNAATYQQAALGATGDGVETDSADKTVGIRGALVVSNGSNFSVVATLVNHGSSTDSLRGVDIEGGDVLQPESGIDVLPDSTTTIGQANSEQFVFGSGLSAEGSKFVRARFVFEKGGIIETNLLVRANDGMWAQIPLP